MEIYVYQRDMHPNYMILPMLFFKIKSVKAFAKKLAFFEQLCYISVSFPLAIEEHYQHGRNKMI